MPELGQAGRGDFSPAGLRRYLCFQALVFWGLIFLAWWTYPGEHRFSIRTHTFSFLGSPNPEHQPRFWWIFSLAQVFWGVSQVPVVGHLRRRFSELSRWGARLGAGCLLAGCTGLVLVGLLPDARTEWVAGLRYTEVHTQAALMIAAGFGSGLLIYGLVLLKGLVAQKPPEPLAGPFPVRRAVGPFAFWYAVSGTCLFMTLRWDWVYAGMKAEAVAAGHAIGSSWAEGLKTWHAFPLWENLAIYALYIALGWLALAVMPRYQHKGTTDP